LFGLIVVTICTLGIWSNLERQWVVRLRTEQKKSHQSEVKYQDLYENAPDMYVSVDAKTAKITECNQTLVNETGYSKKEIIGRFIFEMYSSKSAEYAKTKVFPQFVKTGTIAGEELQLQRKDGSVIDVLLNVSAILDQKGNILGSRSSWRNISEKKNIERNLIESEKRFKDLSENSTDWIWEFDENEIFTYASPSIKKLLGYSPEEIIGRSAFEPMSSPEAKRVMEEFNLHKNAREPFSALVNVNQHKNGREIILESSGVPIIDNEGVYHGYRGIDRNITERIEMEDRLRQAQKMESIGTLAGGIAHDFNNILFPIVGHTEMLLFDIPEDSPFREGLNQIYTGAMRASELVKQILAFSRQESGELKLMKMQPIIKEALKLIRSTIPTTIEIKQNIQADCGAIKADPTQIHQIVMNLATNAYHAMEVTGGELKVSFKQMKLGPLDLINPDMIPGQYACLTVVDTGTGMDKDLTQKIFNPFFTTKAVGKGTGMGLSVVHGIVAGMGGAVRVYSEPGKGTQFYVYFPVEKKSFVKHSVQTHETIQGGIERILLVDDEDAIITMEKLMLERLGYQVTSRTSSIEALEYFRDSPDKFSLVITDMAMPNMPGDKLSVELNKIRPDIPVLLCTGFSETMSEEKAASLGIKGFLFKPIVIKDLAQKIRKILDENKNGDGGE